MRGIEDGSKGRDDGLLRAIAGAKGVRPLARGVGRPASCVSRWKKVPRALVFKAAVVSGVAAEDIRPDLADWIKAERERDWMERARARFAIRSGLDGGTARVRSARDHAAPDGRTMDLLDLGLITAAMRFVAAERGLTVQAIIGAARGGAGGSPTPEQSARSWAMALAVNVGRVNSETVAGLLGVTRQAVDNAAERYLRARDGDDAEDAEDGKVIERGRARRAKTADPALWDAERRFVGQLAGEA
jgi:hypothetical protein